MSRSTASAPRTAAPAAAVDPGAARTRRALAAFLREAAGASGARVGGARRMGGGAVQANWRLEVELEGGPLAGRHELALRTDADSSIAESHTRAEEFAILRAAHAAGVTVPEPLWLCTDAEVIGRPFYLTRFVPGIAAGHRLVRDAQPSVERDALVARLGAELARIHGITPGSAELAFLPLPEAEPARALIARYRHHLDQLPDSHPALEWGLRWCEVHAPPRGEVVLVHRDFRTGNYMVDETGLTGILDWEFAGWGDPMEDIGWFCARCWRFGAREREAGGIADREPFYRAYEQASGRRVEPREVHYWEIMAHIRWAIIALHQAERHISGGETSLELALTGRIAAECELEVLLLTDRLREERD